MTDERDPWQAEADAMDVEERDHDVAYAAELPLELEELEATDDDDPEFAEFFDWLYTLYDEGDQIRLLVLEQSCDADGMLLPWDMRAVRLWTAPPLALAALHLFWDTCPRHVAVQVTLHAFWLVRSERARRRGSPDWSPRHPLPSRVEEHRAFFRPRSLLIRRCS